MDCPDVNALLSDDSLLVVLGGNKSLIDGNPRISSDCCCFFGFYCELSERGSNRLPSPLRGVSASDLPKNSSHEDSPLESDSDSCVLASGGGSRELNDESLSDERLAFFALERFFDSGGGNKYEFFV